MKGRVLFVTKGEDEAFDEGFSYAADLARLRSGGVVVLFSYNERNIFRKFGDEMAAAAFAEAGVVDAARDQLNSDSLELKNECKEKIARLTKGNDNLKDLITGFHAARGAVASSIKKVLEDDPSLEIVIMSPSLTEREKSLNLKKLIKKMPRPIVTMSRPVRA